MDDLSVGGDDLVGALRQLRVINRLLGAAGPTVEGVEALWRAAGRPAALSIVDVGAGSGDLNRPLLAWAERRRVELGITLVDIQPETCNEAAAYFAAEPRVRVWCGDVFDLEADSADIVTAALFTHHVPAAQLPALYRAMLRAARLGIVVNDLHRHVVAWAFIAAATQILSRNRMIRHDAPLSVRRGFRAGDLEALQMCPDLAGLRFAWRPLFRYLVIVPKAAR